MGRELRTLLEEAVRVASAAIVTLKIEYTSNEKGKTCKKFQVDFDMGELRIGSAHVYTLYCFPPPSHVNVVLMLGYPIKYGSQHEWYHLPCLTNVVAKSRSKSFPPNVSGFVGYESLSETDQELVKSLVLRKLTRRPRPISKKRAREEISNNFQ